MFYEAVRLFVAPLVAGLAATFVLHEGIGKLATSFIRDEKKLTEFKAGYMDIVFKLKDILCLWAIGTLIRIAIGK